MTTTWRRLGEVAGRGTPLDVEVRAPFGPITVDARREAALLHASREALANVVKHAGVETARWQVEQGEDSVTVAVVDGGRGIPAGRSPGLGLRTSVIGRIEAVGGSVAVTSGPHGTTVSMTVPTSRRRSSQSLPESFAATLQLPGPGRASSLALRVVVPMALVTTLLALRHGLVGEHWPIQVSTWAFGLAATAWFARRLDRGAPARTSVVGLVAASAVMLALSLGTAGDGAVLGFASWMVLGFSIPLIPLAYVVPLRFAPLYVLPNLVVVLVVIALDPVGDVAGSFGPLSTPFVPVMAGVLGALQRRSAEELAIEQDRLIDESVAAQAVVRTRDLQQSLLSSALAEVVPLLESVARGDLDPDDIDPARAAALAGTIRDDLYAPGLFGTDLRRHAFAFRERGGRLEVRDGVPPDVHAALSEPLTRCLAEAGDDAVVTVSSAAPRRARIVVVPGLGEELTVLDVSATA